ncbi:hypothetical protein K503DRAFT_868289 [Rhizopogon vinicolor AM-OR11-026]|uniref:C2H2-type domain-containing protein n=1 Tax=Rhizopogon vinicolor AM-OR11-026 TaxID=1314800 RepID=A0A1B7MS40_9AGAM|nr:hypothetical protein K503DRAFT_868289 [Rhizopogon vinicolor AM-OR11-026]
MTFNKRQRTPPGSRLSPSSPSLSLTPEPEPMYKSSRIAQEASGDRRLLCTLPPTCNPPHNRPTPIANSRDLELHYGKYHAQVCEQKGCGFVFPDARLLELHQTECHDPLAAVRKDRGEKIFACHLVSCPRLFLTPKARRLHLIQAHSYPKEYFFAVTNKGVGGLLKRWGDGASMIRGTWKPRENEKEQKDSEDDEMAVDEDEDDSDEGEDEESSDEQNGEETPKIRHHQELEEIPTARSIHSPPRRGNGKVQAAADRDMDKLASSINSLSLVPPSIRFGRGGKNGGFVHPEMHNPQVSKFSPHNFGPRGGRGRGRIATAVPRTGFHHAQTGAHNSSADIDFQPGRGTSARGARGGAMNTRGGVINVRGEFRGHGRSS